MKVFDTSALDEKMMPLLSGQEAAWIYNGLDVCVTAEVYNVLMGQLETEPECVKQTYQTALAKMAPILEMSMRGTFIDEEARQKTITELEADLRGLDSKFQRIMREVFGSELNWRSPVQLKNLFYGCLRLKEIKKRNSQGVFAATVNREALEYFDIYLYARPLARFILAMRDIHKQLSFLRTEIDKDQRIRCTYNLAGTNTGRLASSMSEFGTGCVLPTAEALTLTGWKEMRHIRDGEHIAQWDNGEITFVPCKMHKETTDRMLRYETEQLRLTVTPGHRVCYTTYANTEIAVAHAGQLAFKGRKLIPVSGQALGGNLEIPAIAAMLMADFSLEGNVWRGSFKKARKIERLLELCPEVSEIKTSRPGYRRFTLRGYADLPTSWGPWVLSLTPESAEALVQEAAHWDAHKRGESFIFYSADKKQADWFQALCHLTGRGTTMRYSVNSDEAYGNNSVIWAVNVKPRDKAQLDYQHWSVVDYKGEVYCPTVPSSFWLVRENGYVCVTGNTNLQNVNRKLRYPFVADAGMYLVNVDLEQADGRNVGALCHNLFYEADRKTIARLLELQTWNGDEGPDFASKFLNACEGGDLHTTVCRMTWPELDWPDVSELESKAAQKAYKKFCDSLIAHGQDSYRQLAKKLGHGCLTADHEVLTPNGWVSIAEKPDQIMAWNPVTEELQWETPSHWEDKPWHGDMYEIKGNQYNMFATSDHRMPVFNRKGKFVEKPAEFLSLYPEHNLKCVGKLADDVRGAITENQARLVSAAMADAHIYENGSVRWGFSKDRKKRRLEALLGDRKYKVTEYPERNETYYHLPASEVDFPLIKQAGPQMLDWGRAALEAWVDELRHWDGTVQPTFTWIYGKDREHMRWVHTICMLVGQSASYCSNLGHDCARVGLNKRRNRRIGNLNISIKPGNGVQVYCPTVPSSGFITRRNDVIMFSLNTNYYGTPRTMAKHAHVPTKIIEDFQDRYFSQFPAIKAWHNWTINEIRTHGTLITPFGRRRMFFGRGNDASTWRKAIAYAPQSMTGEQIDRGLLQIWRRFKQVQLLNQVHDSILFQVPFREAEHLIPEVLETMKVTIELKGGRPFSVPLEAAAGWNWGYADDNNKYGLVKWTGKEERDRPSPKRRLQDYLQTGRTL